MGGNFWKKWEPIWVKGSHLPNPDDTVDESREVDEYVLTEKSRTVNESEIVEYVELTLGNPKR